VTKVLLNPRSSTAGGGLTYLRNVLPRLSRNVEGNKFAVVIPESRWAEFKSFQSENLSIQVLEGVEAHGMASLMWREQSALRSLIKRESIDVLISLGNFALFNSPVPQILFNRNDLYFSSEFVRDLAARGLYGQIAETFVRRMIARTSMRSAQINVTPTLAFAQKLAGFNGGDVSRFEVLRFGFDRDAFVNTDHLEVAGLRKEAGVRRLLYVSHYNYFRNFETLIRALPLIDRSLADLTGERVQLALTTDIRNGAVYGGYDATSASHLIDKLGMRDRILMLGEVPYNKLYSLYETADAFVCPSYSESFGHPLLEAIAAGVPVIAANLPVHREVCGDAAVYFDPFDEHALARECLSVLTNEALRARLKSAAKDEILRFSWDRHVEELGNLIERLKRSRQEKR